MKITMIGSGSCYSVPTIGNDWGDCDPTNPKNRRTVASLLIESATTKILIDMSPDFREQSIRHDLTGLNAILFTHGHSDHILGHFYLPRLLQYYKDKKLPLYADKATQQEIEKAFWFQVGDNGKTLFSYGGETHWEEILANQAFTIGDLTILPLLQDHGDMVSYTFRIGNFAYSTDFNALPPQTMDQLKGLDVWIAECNRKNASSNAAKHLYLDKVIDLSAQLQPKSTYLTHMGVTLDYAKTTAILPAGVHMGYDGLVIEI